MRLKRNRYSVLISLVYASIFLSLASAIVHAFESLKLNNSFGYFGEALPENVHLFSSDANAERVIEEIVSVSGLPRNFKVKAAGVPNASAVVVGQDRLILYNQAFVQNLTEVTQSTWSPYLIMAHEIGHHLSGHTLSLEGSRPNKELEADQYSGFVMHKLGASLDEALISMKILAPNFATKTHPARHDRLAAITNGWMSSCNKDVNCGDNSSENSAKFPSSPSTSENVLKRFGKLVVKLQNSTGRMTNQPSIRIMNIKPKYYDEIELALGQEYHIRIDEVGYAPIEKNIVMTKSNQIELIDLNSVSIAEANRKGAIKEVAELRGVSYAKAEQLYKSHEIFSNAAANWAIKAQDEIASNWHKTKVYRQPTMNCAVVLSVDDPNSTSPFKLNSVGYCANSNYRKMKNGRSVYTTRVKKDITTAYQKSMKEAMEATLPQLRVPPELLSLGFDVGFDQDTVLTILRKAIPRVYKYESNLERENRQASWKSKLLNTITYYR